MLDENQTGRFGYKVDRPVVDDGAILDVGVERRRRLHRLHVLRRRRPALRAAVGGPRRVGDRGRQLAAQPARGPPDPRGPQAGARCDPLTATGATPARPRSPRSTEASGSSTPARAASPRTSSVKGAVAVVSGTCGDLTGTAQTLRGRGCRGDGGLRRPLVRSARAPSTGPSRCPRCRAEPWDARTLLAGGPAGRSWPRTPVAGLHVRPRAASGATASRTVAPCRRYRHVRLGPGRALQRHGQHERRRPAGGRGAGRLGARARRRRQHRAGPAGSVPHDRDPLRLHRARVGAHRGRSRTPSTAASTAGCTRLAATYAGGSTTHDTWFGGPVGSRVSPLFAVDQRLAAADARGRRAVPVHGRVHRRGRAHGELRPSSAPSSTARSTPTTSWSSTCSRRCS